ncbi:hypothetical protein AO385_1826 [Moraxella catarrhalis]|uniref:Uncharacterized protein n=1 Tax=Moraxella catarrhalis TaxID=480 RepID=A0A198UN10_MORCA|nr:hypothetical protein AO383_1661 [Moraxella catarrhalis]OAU96462.1 hypothetical protein AO385_1826 [Moraxella catarrhalis]OAU97741.1 hypothetical protein AO384_0427 [Moraxella catarrhalis]
MKISSPFHGIIGLIIDHKIGLYQDHFGLGGAQKKCLVHAR